VDVRDDRDNKQFVIEAEGDSARLEYRTRADRLVLVHTEVPEALEGHGIGGTLVRAALDRARAENLTVVPLCPFARKWIEGHADVAHGITIDWSLEATNG
jgi:uncharacterized protein